MWVIHLNIIIFTTTASWLCVCQRKLKSYYKMTIIAHHSGLVSMATSQEESQDLFLPLGLLKETYNCSIKTSEVFCKKVKHKQAWAYNYVHCKNTGFSRWCSLRCRWLPQHKKEYRRDKLWEVCLIWNYRLESREKPWRMVRTVDQLGINAGDWSFLSPHAGKMDCNVIYIKWKFLNEVLSNTALLLM